MTVVSMAPFPATLFESSFHEISDEIANLSRHRGVLDFGLHKKCVRSFTLVSRMAWDL